MLSRAAIVRYTKYLFDNINNFDCKNYVTYIKNNNFDLPEDMNAEVNNIYYEILLNNKTIDIETQIKLAESNYLKFKQYLLDNSIKDLKVNAIINLMEIEIPTLVKFLRSREPARKIRRGYK